MKLCVKEMMESTFLKKNSTSSTSLSGMEFAASPLTIEFCMISFASMKLDLERRKYRWAVWITMRVLSSAWHKISTPWWKYPTPATIRFWIWSAILNSFKLKCNFTKFLKITEIFVSFKICDDLTSFLRKVLKKKDLFILSTI